MRDGKSWDQLNPLEQLVRRTARCGMTQGTVMTIEFISGFELFNTRPYHNYETWSQGWRVHGLGVITEREDLDVALIEWAEAVTKRRAGDSITLSDERMRRDGGPYHAAIPIADWIEPSDV